MRARALLGQRNSRRAHAAYSQAHMQNRGDSPYNIAALSTL
jgi:hypothetical protein